MDIFGKTPRPVFNKEMLRKLAIVTAGYLGKNNPDEDDLEEIEKVLDRHKNDDGYELGKRFEDAGFDVDASVVSELDCVSGEARDILDTYIREWVIADSITPKLPTGTVVKLNPRRYRQAEGTIAGLIEDKAQYRVPVDNSNAYYCVNYEELEEQEKEKQTA